VVLDNWRPIEGDFGAKIGHALDNRAVSIYFLTTQVFLTFPDNRNINENLPTEGGKARETDRENKNIKEWPGG